MGIDEEDTVMIKEGIHVSPSYDVNVDNIDQMKIKDLKTFLEKCNSKNLEEDSVVLLNEPFKMNSIDNSMNEQTHYQTIRGFS